MFIVLAVLFLHHYLGVEVAVEKDPVVTGRVDPCFERIKGGRLPEGKVFTRGAGTVSGLADPVLGQRSVLAAMREVILSRHVDRMGAGRTRQFRIRRQGLPALLRAIAIERRSELRRFRVRCHGTAR